MSMPSIAGGAGIRRRCSEEEWQTRLELARCYRLMARARMTDLTATHVSMRVPGLDEHYLLNDARQMFEEVTASSLVKFDLGGNLLDGEGMLNPAGFAIHSVIHRARPDARCVLHAHTRAGCALAALDTELKMINQINLIFDGKVGYNDYAFIETPEDCAGLPEDLGDNVALIMRNHGLLTVGRTVAEAFVLMFYLDKACEIQLDAMAAGVRLVEPPAAVRKSAHEGWWNWYGEQPFGQTAWDALVRRLDSEDRSYAS